MDILNSRAPMNRALAVIDGRLHSKTGISQPPTAQKPKLLEQVRQAIRARHYSAKPRKPMFIGSTGTYSFITSATR